MPAWMTDLGLADKLGKKSHRKVTLIFTAPATVGEVDVAVVDGVVDVVAVETQNLRTLVDFI